MNINMQPLTDALTALRDNVSEAKQPRMNLDSIIGTYSEASLRPEDLIPAYVAMAEETGTDFDKNEVPLPEDEFWTEWADDLAIDIADQVYAETGTLIVVGAHEGDPACVGIWVDDTAPEA